MGQPLRWLTGLQGFLRLSVPKPGLSVPPASRAGGLGVSQNSIHTAETLGGMGKGDFPRQRGKQRGPTPAPGLASLFSNKMTWKKAALPKIPWRWLGSSPLPKCLPRQAVAGPWPGGTLPARMPEVSSRGMP